MRPYLDCILAYEAGVVVGRRLGRDNNISFDDMHQEVTRAD